MPLNSATRTALEEWLAARADQVARAQRAHDPKALWLARSGARLSRRAIDMVVRTLAEDAALDASAYVLRHTCVTNLVAGRHRRRAGGGAGRPPRSDIGATVRIRP